MNKTNLAKILKAFHLLKIPFALAGGHAVAAWGVVRATRDIDFLADAAGELAAKLVLELKKAGFSLVFRKGDEADPLRGVIHVEMKGSADDELVDIVLGIRNMPQGIFERSLALDFLGLEIPTVAPEDMIILKCLAGGPIDLEDARSILFIMKKRLDMKYLERELKRCRISLQKLEQGR
ncbi:MAG: hypothetical protein KJ808_05080 [Acidobacteria bacterium]|nr:hypothetical protein [Acidobacteriota bacterium]MBU4307911.1 hypothetical protein [Acidobacteriota bacterium]MBU4405924.1 hypothetical protein [Acidobacteriota bacterium]MCG2811049.1 hypothetical protein [Candidatus Aminicenantes bacterium]